MVSSISIFFPSSTVTSARYIPHLTLKASISKTGADNRSSGTHGIQRGWPVEMRLLRWPRIRRKQVEGSWLREKL